MANTPTPVTLEQLREQHLCRVRHLITQIGDHKHHAAHKEVLTKYVAGIDAQIAAAQKDQEDNG